CYLIYFCCQAEDGIRDRNVTGVQTCALPIYRRETEQGTSSNRVTSLLNEHRKTVANSIRASSQAIKKESSCAKSNIIIGLSLRRSEERRVGKEWKCPKAWSDMKKR